MTEYEAQAKQFLADCNATMEIKFIGKEIPTHWLGETKPHNNRSKAEQCLIDNGIEPNEAPVVLQALGYILLDEELYPEEEVE